MIEPSRARGRALVCIAAALVGLGMSMTVAPADELDDLCGTAIFTPTETIMVQPGEQFAIELDAQPGTGYGWSIVEPPDASVVAVFGAQLSAPSHPIPGSAEQQCFGFNAVGPGLTSIGLAYARPFETDAAPARTASVQVIVAALDVPVQLPLPST